MPNSNTVIHSDEGGVYESFVNNCQLLVRMETADLIWPGHNG